MMRFNLRRNALAAFLLTLGCGVGLWYFLAQRNANAPSQRAQDKPASLSKFFPGNDAPPQVRFVPCRAAQKIDGFPNAKAISLRESPDIAAPVSMKIEMRYPFEILEATRDFIHVRYPDRARTYFIKEEERARLRKGEGWATYADIIPFLSAIVLDAETGATVSRFLLEDNNDDLAFSPDGKRIIFYGGDRAYEVLTSDYTTARCLEATLSHYISAVFFHPDGTLYAAVFQSGEPSDFRDRQMNVVRVSEPGEASQLTEISTSASFFTISGDGLTGFITHQTNNNVEQIDVVDLQALKIRNSFRLDCDDCPLWFSLNESGSELYTKPYSSTSIRVIDTRTGRRVREIPYDAEHEPLSPGRRIGGEVLAGGSRFNINKTGTQLLKLDEEGNIQESFPIERPEFEHNPEGADYIFARGLKASPDGRYLIFFTHFSPETLITISCSPTRKHSH